MGVSSKEGWAQLSIPKESNVNEGIASLEKMDNPALTYSVQTVTLSKFLESSATLIKIDVEGHEFDVLMGAEQLFKQKAVSHIIFEDHDIHNSKIPAFLEKIGYCIFSIGWDMNGVILKPLSSSNTFLINDAPNFIATLEPESVHRIVEKSGWTVLSGLAEERVA